MDDQDYCRGRRPLHPHSICWRRYYGVRYCDISKTDFNIVISGLLIQLISFEFFVVISAIFHFRIGRQPTPWAQKDRVLSMRRTWRERNWGSLLLTLYMTNGLILIGSIFRMIEYQGGPDGYFIKHEAYSFIFVTHI